MVRRPTVHPASVTLGELREFFADDHVHIALLVEAGRLVGAVERDDLPADVGDDGPARAYATVAWRTVGPEMMLAEARARLRRRGSRRLAVVREDGALVGLLCLKKSGAGFCSDSDVRSRRSISG
jgi:CBS domain-containing protein